MVTEQRKLYQVWLQSGDSYTYETHESARTVAGMTVAVVMIQGHSVKTRRSFGNSEMVFWRNSGCCALRCSLFR